VRVVIADDHRLVLDGIKRALESDGGFEIVGETQSGTQVLPLVGKMVSKHQSAYSYLPASVGTFPSPHEFAATIAATGFSQVRAVPLTFGIVYLYIAERQ